MARTIAEGNPDEGVETVTVVDVQKPVTVQRMVAVPPGAHVQFNIPQDYLEAAWAGAAHPAYCAYMETSDDDWRGPVRGPLAMAMAIVNDAMYGLSDNPNVALRAC